MSEDRGAAEGGAHKPALSVLIRVRGAMPSLRPAEQRVAHAVLADPAAISESSITTVARQCHTSETTVLRFCRAIGLAGYPELSGGAPRNGTINAGDSVSDLIDKIIYADARAIEDTGGALDVETLTAAIDAVCAARRIDLYGVGASALLAHDLHHKLHRIGLTSFSWSDPHLALTSAAMLGDTDVAIGISHTGTTIDVLDALRVAREHGATTIGVTNFVKAPIAGHADLLLTTAARETTFRSGPMASRIAQLVVVDCLFAGVAQRHYDSAIGALETTYAAVQSRHGARRP